MKLTADIRVAIDAITSTEELGQLVTKAVALGFLVDEAGPHREQHGKYRLVLTSGRFVTAESVHRGLGSLLGEPVDDSAANS